MYKKLIRPLLFKMDPERVHELAALALSMPFSGPIWKGWKRLNDKHFPQLKTSFCGIECQHPIGLAAGFDKDATMVGNLSCLGFSHVEIGTVTGQAQPGNQKKRLFRLPMDQALINRMGFNNLGVEAAAKKLQNRTISIPLGGNIGKTKIVPLGEPALKDYEFSFLSLRPFIDYLVVNVSSPNTPGLRTLQDKGPLRELLQHLNRLNDESKCPILLKIAPDLSEQQLDEIVEVVEETNLSGVIATNTTIEREPLQTDHEKVLSLGAGGLSGAPLFKKSTQILRYLRRNLKPTVDLIGVGGIMSGADVYEKLKAGAKAVQVYTGFIYRGPAGIFEMKKELVELMQRDGVATLADCIGVECENR